MNKQVTDQKIQYQGKYSSENKYLDSICSNPIYSMDPYTWKTYLEDDEIINTYLSYNTIY